MKKTAYIIAALCIASLPLSAQQVNEDSFSRLSVSYQTEAFSVNETTADGATYCTLSFNGSIDAGEAGSPALPQMASLIEVPVCKGFNVMVSNAVYDTIVLPMQVIPAQPSRSKSDTSARHMVIDHEVYSTDSFIGSKLATVDYIGVARDRHIARLVFSPVMVNPVQGKAIVCRSADITVEYIGADEDATKDLYQRYNTPAYSVGKTLNNLPKPKYVSNATPVRMAVVLPSSLHSKKLEEFLSWKRQQGLRVDVFYIDKLGILSSAAIASMLKGLYTDATSTDPAPAYLLIIGDVAQVPAHSSKISGGWYGPDSDHITDLYYTTWSGSDKVPDCYHGRMSATDTTTLNNILNKTMLYERYQFSDDSYLARAALIAGVDGGSTGDHGYTHADPAMDYTAVHYVNHAYGYDTVTYYKNLTTHRPNNIPVTGSSNPSSTATALRLFYNQGAGWINYSAHGNWDCWGQPSFTVSQVNSMTNTGMPSFIIGNCCLTNKFEKSVCFGEALLRRANNAGAIGYIGGSNSTYWDQDFYWAVGVRSNISGTMNLSYNANNLGIYDRLFHTHNEALSSTVNTAGKLMYYGNMAVQNSGSSSTFKDYYWEIYHLMGDPTLMPWLGRAKDPYVSIYDAGSTLYVGTVTGAYVAVVDPADSMRVVCATFADATGNATLDRHSSHSALMLSITVQG